MSRVAHPRVTGFVYFALNREMGLVRIGSSVNPREQLRKLQTANPEELTLSLVIPGTDHSLRAIGAKFAGCHIANSWYDARKIAGILFGIPDGESVS